MHELQDYLPSTCPVLLEKSGVGTLCFLVAIGVWNTSALSGEDEFDRRCGDSVTCCVAADALAPEDTEATEPDDRRPKQSEGNVGRLKAKQKHPVFSLRRREDVQRLLADFPDLSRVDSLRIEDVGVTSIPDALLEKIAAGAKSLRSLSIGIGTSPQRRAARISDGGMDALSKLSGLQRLVLDCRFSADGFARLTKLKELKTLGTDSPAFGADEYFKTVSKLPNIRSLGVRYADFSQPIDAKTFEAIASLNGRLEELSFGEWQETTIHASMIPAIAEIKSLTHLYLGQVTGSLPQPWAYYLRKLPYLERLEPSTKETSGATAFEGLQERENCPVQFRTVKSPAEMIVLLRFVLGPFEAVKVRREVARRRAGVSPRPPEGYPQSRYPLLVTILEESFEMKASGSACRILPHITHEYPELDQQIRRYLAGEDFVDEEAEAEQPDE